MTIASTTRRAGPYSGNDATTEFSFAFKVFAEGDIQVFVTDTNVTTELVLNVDYSVALNADQDESPGGSITYPISGDPLATGLTLDIQGDIAYTQPAALPQGGNFSPRVIENALDRLTMQTIQLADALELGAIPGGVSLSGLPNAAARANLLLGFDSDGNPVVVAPAAGSATELAINLAAADDETKGAGQVGFFQDGTGAVARTMLDKAREVVSVDDFGAVGDFDPATGLGTDDRAAIQRAFDYACSLVHGAKVIFTAGKRYYGGAAVGAYAGGVAIVLGDTPVSSAKNISVEAFGAEIYQGNVGRFIGIFGADRVTFEGAKIFGYTGGTLGSSRENDAILCVNYSSKHVKIRNNYLTNSLGDCIYVGGTLVSGGLTGYYAQSIEISHNTLKTRYGNGTASVSGGTKSRTALAVIDCVGLDFHHNTVLGNVDLEPNLDNQHIVNCHVDDNEFKSGHVTAQSSIGTAYWHDEPTAYSGGSSLPNNITITGVASAPLVYGNTVERNAIENGYVSDYNVYKFDRVHSNVFQAGQVITGSTTGTNDTSDRSIVGNRFIAPLSGETCAIRLNGFLIGSVIANNEAATGFTYVVNNPAGGSTGDGGRIAILNNVIRAGTSVNNLTLIATSTEHGSVNLNGAINPAISSSIQPSTVYTPQVAVPVVGTNQTVNWNTYKGNCWFTTQAGGANASISQISNPPPDGTLLEVVSGASGGGSLTLVHGSSFIRLKGSVDAAIPDNSSLTLRARAGIWFEKCRGF